MDREGRTNDVVRQLTREGALLRALELAQDEGQSELRGLLRWLRENEPEEPAPDGHRMTVMFAEAEEFLEEVERERPAVVRVSQLSRWGGNASRFGLYRLFVVATARVGGDVLRLERYCGELGGIGPGDHAVREHAATIIEHVCETVGELGLEARSGVLCHAGEVTP